MLIGINSFYENDRKRVVHSKMNFQFALMRSEVIDNAFQLFTPHSKEIPALL